MATWRFSLTQLQQSGWSTGSDKEKFDTWVLEIFGCNISFVQGNFESPKCQDWRIRAMHKPSIMGRNHCCVTQKLAIGFRLVRRPIRGDLHLKLKLHKMDGKGRDA